MRTTPASISGKFAVLVLQLLMQRLFELGTVPSRGTAQLLTPTRSFPGFPESSLGRLTKSVGIHAWTGMAFVRLCERAPVPTKGRTSPCVQFTLRKIG